MGDGFADKLVELKFRGDQTLRTVRSEQLLINSWRDMTDSPPVAQSLLQAEEREQSWREQGLDIVGNVGSGGWVRVIW
jgi:hypothetical protein